MTAVLDAFIKTLERLEIVIDSETTALQQNQAIDLADFNHKKRHGLLELSRSIRFLDEESLRAAQPDLHRLHDKVEKNLSILEIHIKAVHEVAAIIANAIQQNESDGTYSRWLASQGKG